MTGELTKLVKQHYTNLSEGQIDRDRDILSDDIVHTNAAIGTVVSKHSWPLRAVSKRPFLIYTGTCASSSRALT